MSWGLVLGGGGVLGGAWMTGALSALADVHGLDPREADLLVGTSAGSVTAALLAAGVSVDELRDHQLGRRPRSGPLSRAEWDYDRDTGGSSPPLPRMGPGSSHLMRDNARRLRRLPPTAVAAALMPEGRGSIARVGELVDAVVPGGGWAPREGIWVVAMDYGSGARTVFGRHDDRHHDSDAPLARAVMASCAIPGWYAPVSIGGRRYADGGACSATNLDVAAGLGLDVLYVLAPMVSFAMDSPVHWRTRMERSWRARVTRRCLREVAKVHATGTEVTVLGPGPEDLAAMGDNLMAVERRRAVLDVALRTTSAELLRPRAAGGAAHAGGVRPLGRPVTVVTL